jgi:hypothetical protein
LQLDTIQTLIVSRVAAVPALAALGSVLVFDPLADANDPTTGAKKLIADRLRDPGVCLEIGLPQIPLAENSDTGATDADVEVELYLAESPVKPHTPTGLALVQRVITAVRVPADRHDITLIGYDTAKHESGYILHVLTFRLKTVLR